MSKHSPFPWEQQGSYIVHTGDDCGAVALLAEPEARTSDDVKSIDIGSRNWDRAMANGKVIIAAPLLAEALADFVARFARLRLLCGEQEVPMGIASLLYDTNDAARAALVAAGIEEA